MPIRNRSRLHSLTTASVLLVWLAGTASAQPAPPAPSAAKTAREPKKVTPPAEKPAPDPAADAKAKADLRKANADAALVEAQAAKTIADARKTDAEANKADAEARKADAEARKVQAPSKNPEPPKKTEQGKKAGEAEKGSEPATAAKDDSNHGAEPAAPTLANDAATTTTPGSAPATSAPAPAPTKPQPIPLGKVSVDATSGGWVVSRKIEKGETGCTLRYSYPGFAARSVEGTRDSDSWKFGISDKIPGDVVVQLEFVVLKSIDDPVRAKRDLYDYLIKLGKVLDESALAPGSSPEITRAAYAVRVREAVAELNSTSALSTYSIKDGEGRRSASAAALTKLGLKEIGPGMWEPTDDTATKLRVLWTGKALAYAQVAAILGEQPPAASCFKSAPAMRQDADAKDPAVLKERVAGLEACFKSAYTTYSPFLTPDHFDPKVKGDVEAAAANLKAVGEPILAGKATAGSYVAVSADSATGHTQLVKEELDRPLRDALKLKPTSPDAQAARTKSLLARIAMTYVAALMAVDQRRAEFEAELQAKLGPDWNGAAIVQQFSYEGTAKDLFKALPGNPRFFVSTGVLATHLEDRWKLALPVLVSVCLSPHGCETKATYNTKTDGGQYLSVDLGIKTVFLGDSDPRESKPSFLLGLGITPVYATHFSFGMNAFENNQTARANLAFYVAVSLDLINGRDILGELGVGKPKVERIGETQ